MKRFILLFSGIAVAACLGLIGLAWYGLEQWTRPKRRAHDKQPGDFNLPCEEVEFRSRKDGVRLRGWLIDPHPGPDGAGRRAVIFCHGHGGTCAPDLIYAPWFYERGVPVLMFDFRNHGLSEGTLTSMAFYERDDLLGAVDFMASRGYPQVGLFGFSMGAATAVATAPLSERIMCVVADSPFAQLRPTLARAIEQRGWPRWFALRLINLIFWMARIRLRCDLSEADPIRAVRRFDGRPLLIILGQHDEYIEPWQAQWLFETATDPKQLWLVPGVSHRDVDRFRPEEYYERVMGFFEKWLFAN